MDLSVLIPTFNRPEKVAACALALSRQTLDPDRFEVLIGIDGPERGERETISRALRDEQAASRLRIETAAFPKCGQASVRNRLLERARARFLLFLNDDMLPSPPCAAAHLREQQQLLQAGRPALIIGDCPWRIHQPDRLFDRLIRETSMVFFFDHMRGTGSEPHRDWGFRHAWLLNLSAPAAMVREVGGFTAFPDTYGYEDDELAWRLKERFGTPVLYRPDAAAIHDHRYEPEEYLARERRLGHAAWGFAKAAPACACAMFARDITSPEEVAYSRAFVDRERAGVERLRESFLATAQLPSAAIDGLHAPDLLRLIYQQHLLLKRWEWRRGHLEAATAAGALA